MTALVEQAASAATADHQWVGAAYVSLQLPQARYAARRGSIRVAEKTRVEVLDVYCNGCRRPFDDVKDEPCEAVINNEHLRGGPIGERKKRGTRGSEDTD
jgi:hypothetical protein